MKFKLVSKFKPTGDQPQAIEELIRLIKDHLGHTTLMGVTGSGKTFTIANVIARLGRPVLVLSHNKTLAFQLYKELAGFFPENVVCYFVSYYDYYQPEAYLPASNTYIEKDLSINEEIERLRLETTSALLSGRRDVIVVASVSCLYGIGNPEDFNATAIKLEKGESLSRKQFFYSLVGAQYTRTETELTNGTFRVNGETVDVKPAFGDACYRIAFFGNEVDSIASIDPASGQSLEKLDRVTIYPANLFVTTKEKTEAAIRQIQLDLGEQIKFFEEQGKHLEAQRIKQRVEYDLEMIKELGYCSGIENYSRYLDGREPGTRPFCLLDYFPEDYLLVVDESHVTIPQIRAMYGGDYSRKRNLVDFGFRLPAAIDNRPLQFQEFEQLAGQTIYVSATPADYEIIKSEGILVEQLIRPTGLIDPPMNIRITDNQIDDLMDEIRTRTERRERVLVTTLTKRMAEELSKYLTRMDIANRYIHSEVETLERVAILEGLRSGEFDVLIGVNLLREGLDLPEVSLVAIMDADKEGFLRNARSLTQTAGRTARNVRGEVILYGDKRTDSMLDAIAESSRRRDKQLNYLMANEIVPTQAIRNEAPQPAAADDTTVLYPLGGGYALAADRRGEYETAEDIDQAIEAERLLMDQAAQRKDFIAAARHRDRMYALQAEAEKMVPDEKEK